MCYFMLTFWNSYVLWLLRCVQLGLVTVTICDVNVVWCYVLSQYHFVSFDDCFRPLARKYLKLGKQIALVVVLRATPMVWKLSCCDTLATKLKDVSEMSSFLEDDGHRCPRWKDDNESRRFLGGEGHHCQGWKAGCRAQGSRIPRQGKKKYRNKKFFRFKIFFSLSRNKRNLFPMALELDYY